MRKKIATLLLISFISAGSVFADFSFVDESDFTGDAFFTPPALQKQQQKTKDESMHSSSHSIPPLKKLRLRAKKKLRERNARKNELAPVAPIDDLYSAGAETSEYASKEIKDDFDDTMMPDGFEADEEAVKDNIETKRFRQKKDKNNKNAQAQTDKESIILDCANVDYDTDNNSVIATGNVIVNFVEQKTVVKADKITYDRTNNTIKAEGNVKIIKNGRTTYGEYIFVDMNEENALIEKPVTRSSSVEIRAQKGYVYGDKIVQENGTLEVSDSFPVQHRSAKNGPWISKMMKSPEDETLTEDMENRLIRLEAKDITVTRKGDLDVISLKKAVVYKGKRKIYKIPSLKIYTNKNFDFAETNSWEIGSVRGMGMYLGPGVVFEIPGGSVLKAMPILNYHHDIGVGGLLRFSNASNWTQAAYGTADSNFLVRGTQELDDYLYLEYVMNDYLHEWFLGRRRAKYGASLVYERGYSKQNFLIKGQNSSFSHRLSTGYYEDSDLDYKYRKRKGTQIGTTRTRYMAQASQNIFSYRNEEKQTAFAFGVRAQLAASLYGTGDTQVIGRLGPTLHTQYRRWMQDLGYYQSVYEDNTPMPVFDAYRYGKSNFYLREYFRLCKYITLVWFGSMNLSEDSPNNRTLQENTFYVSFGPDDVKFSIGYDFVRQNTRFLVEVMMDAKGSKIDYERLEIKQEKKAKKKDEVKEEDESDFQKADTPPVLQHAVVEDIKTLEDVL